MASPFIFGKVVSGSNFTDREYELSRLSENIRNKTNIILISPRRWGKSSLIERLRELIGTTKKNRFVMLDLFNIRDENQFYAYFAKKVIKATSSKPREWLEIASNYLKRLTPKISFPINYLNDFEITFELKDINDDFEEILNLPEKISVLKNINLTVCIDEFQNIESFSNPLLLQKRLRSAWQKHKNAVYCLYGSQTSMMKTLFENKSMPFYKFGDVIYLSKIDSQYLIKYIMNQFSKTGKQISESTAEKITSSVQCHPYYTQQLSHIVWVNTPKKANDEIFEKSLNDLIYQNSILYIKEAEELSNTQINFLKLLIFSQRSDYYSQELIKQYNLGTSANVAKIVTSLVQKDIINSNLGRYEITDPVFGLWLEKIYFKNN
jgi:hypothetical protein